MLESYNKIKSLNNEMKLDGNKRHGRDHEHHDSRVSVNQDRMNKMRGNPSNGQ